MLAILPAVYYFVTMAVGIVWIAKSIEGTL